MRRPSELFFFFFSRKSPQQHRRPVAPEVQDEISYSRSPSSRGFEASAEEKEGGREQRSRCCRRRRRRRCCCRGRPSPLSSPSVPPLRSSPSSSSPASPAREVAELPRANGHQRRRPHQCFEGLEVGPAGDGTLLGGVPRRGRCGRRAGEQGRSDRGVQDVEEARRGER